MNFDTWRSIGGRKEDRSEQHGGHNVRITMERPIPYLRIGSPAGSRNLEAEWL